MNIKARYNADLRKQPDLDDLYESKTLHEPQTINAPARSGKDIVTRIPMENCNEF